MGGPPEPTLEPLELPEPLGTDPGTCTGTSPEPILDPHPEAALILHLGVDPKAKAVGEQRRIERKNYSTIPNHHQSL